MGLAMQARAYGTLQLVTVVLLLLTQTRIHASVGNNNSLIKLPNWREYSEYVTQCVLNNYGYINASCDWTLVKDDTDEFNSPVSSLMSRPLEFKSKACLEFWYQSPKARNVSQCRVLLKSNTGLKEIWTIPTVDSDAWIHEFVSLDITEPGSQVVFEATKDTFMEGQVGFDRMGVRKGQCGKQCKPNTQFWTDKSTLCLCSGEQLSCFSSQCPEGQQCGPHGEVPSGSTTPGTCTVHSDPHCSAFDGVLYSLMAPCTYVLAKTCSPSDALPMFSVNVVSKQMRNSSASSVQQVNMELVNLRISLLKKETQRAMVNGIWRTLPLILSGGTVKIYGNGASVLVETAYKLAVSYDKAGVVHINLPFLYSGQVCGLCGNFNSRRFDDYQTAAVKAVASGPSPQTQGADVCDVTVVPHKCDSSEEAEYASEAYCGSLLSATLPFAACVSVVEAESYFRSCVAGMCGSHGDMGVLCEKLQAYADICQEAGILLPDWRNSSHCPLECGENSHFNACADGCPEVCSSLDAVGACGSCQQRCECEPGFQLSGGRCVLAGECGCWRNGHHYEKGTLFLDGECEQQCQCMGNNIASCTAWHCAENEVCKVIDGDKGCFPSKPITCSVYGDPHYITFDGRDLDFQGGCNYTLTTTCGKQSPAQFTVTGRNLFPIAQDLTRSKIEAVALQTEGLHIILNQNRDVYVNKITVALPYTTNGSFGYITVYRKAQYVVLETTFGLRMMIDGQNRLFLQVDERYFGQLCGLCGTYSNSQADDFIRPDGSYASSAFDFGSSWSVKDDTLCTSSPDQPRTCTAQEEDQAYTECQKLLGDVFSPCNSVIHPLTHIHSCVYDYCATGGDQQTLCSSLESYAAACQVAGVELAHWQNNTACAHPPTTATPPTSPTPDQTICPLNCNFDNNMCGWQQLIQDSFDWTRQTGPTLSSSTGPNHDHTTGEGFYMYTEGDGVSHGDSARLLSSTCHHGGTMCLHFWYHMYGSATAMALNIYQLLEGRAMKLWAKVNSQGPEWRPAFVDVNVTSSFQIIVEGIRGSSALSDVSIDDISIHLGSCSDIFFDLIQSPTLPPTSTEGLHSHSACHLDCSFDRNLCGWSQMVTDAFDWTWKSGSTPTLLTGPSADHTGGEDGHYLYIEANSATHGDTARLLSAGCSLTGPRCLHFWYHMYGSADTMGLHVYLVQGSLAGAVWRKRNDHGNMWHLAQVDFTPAGPFQILFEGRRGSNDQSDVAIDDVKLYHGPCSGQTSDGHQSPEVNVAAQPLVTDHTPGETTALPLYVEATAEYTHVAEDLPPSSADAHQVCRVNCDFERDLCEWNQLLTDVFDWTRHSGSTPTMFTGPSSDHTIGNGHYLYIEANSATHGDTARLLSAGCSLTGPQCLHFWYHMYGSADTMGLHVYLVQGSLADAVWRKRNDQGNMWHLAQVDFTPAGPFQILFEGRRGSNDQSDVAIDDVKLYHGPCSGQTSDGHQSPEVNVAAQPLVTDHTPGETTALPLYVEATAEYTHVAKDLPPSSADAHQVCRVNCDFERDLCEWNQLLTDVFDWTRHSGSTPTMFTGPSSDHTIGNGHYLYIEANSATHGDTARLLSAGCSLTGPQCLHFWYHMYGSADTMGLHVYLVQGSLADAVWRKRNDQGNMWHLAQVDFTPAGPFQILFEGRRGSNDQSDMAIDDVKLYHGPCSGQTSDGHQSPEVNVAAQSLVTDHTPGETTALPLYVEATAEYTHVAKDLPPSSADAHQVCRVNCDFERDLCEWNQLLTDVFDWTRHSGSTPTMFTGPSSDHTIGNGHYLYIEANSATHGDTARLLSAGCSLTGPQCLHFWYHMYGSADTMGLHVYLVQGSLADAVWRKRNDQGNMWRLAQVDFTPAGPFQILFEGRRGSNDQSDVAIDDVKLYHGPCSGQTSDGHQSPEVNVAAQPLVTDHTPGETTALPLYVEATAEYTHVAEDLPPSSADAHQVCRVNCDFERDLCEWNQLLTDVFHWTRHSGSTPTMFTGPSSDHTIGNGHYLYIEANSATHGDTARLLSSGCSLTGPQCLHFWYHMYGSADTMGLHVYLVQGSLADAVWRKRNDQGNMWHLAQVDFTPAGPFQILFEGRRGSNDQSDVAIDDVKLYHGPCSGTLIVPPGLELRPTTLANPGSQTTIMPLKPQPQTTALPLRMERPEPRTIHPPTPSCPYNSHYSTCACQPSCEHLYDPPDCREDESCTPGCVCDEGFVLEQSACVPTRQCGCVDRDGNMRHLDEVWYTSHCSHRCRCKIDEEMVKTDCDIGHDGCDGDAVCLQEENGQYYCQATDFSECTIEGAPEYITFDGLKYSFVGERSYMLVQTGSLPANLPDVCIVGINARNHGDEQDLNDDDEEGHWRRHRLVELKIRVYNHTVEFKRNRRVILDGRETLVPVSPFGGLEIVERSSRIQLKTDFGLSVEFDGQHKTEITLPHIYKRKVRGLCGNFDGKQKNDLIKPDGSQATSPQEFGQSWRVTEDSLSTRWRRATSFHTTVRD